LSLSFFFDAVKSFSQNLISWYGGFKDIQISPTLHLLKGPENVLRADNQSSILKFRLAPVYLSKNQVWS
jgi:hypothetical protein